MVDLPDFSMFWKTSASVMTRADASGSSGTTREKRMLTVINCNAEKRERMERWLRVLPRD
jgi:hypothetical protein